LKILFVGPNYGGGANEFKIGTGQYHMVKGLRNIGHDVEVFKYITRIESAPTLSSLKSSFYRFLPNRVCDAVLRGFLYEHVPFEVMIDAQGYSSQNKEFLNRVFSCKPDLVLVSYGLFLLPSTLKKLRKTVPTVLLYGISPSYWSTKHEKSCFPLYDAIVANGPDKAKEFEKYVNNAIYLPFSACDPDVHRSIQLSELERKRFGNDVCFVGTIYPNRMDALEKLTSFDFGLWGPEVNPISRETLRKCYKGKALVKEFVKIYSASKITMNMFAPGDDFGVNMRLFEAPACGILQVAENKPGISSFFKVGEEIVCYENVDELTELVKYYLRNPDERILIAKKGQKRAHSDHTYERRMASLISVLRSRGII
jgi:spore maturation protein CgeB